jgi:hypothetical protein
MILFERTSYIPTCIIKLYANRTTLFYIENISHGLSPNFKGILSYSLVKNRPTNKAGILGSNQTYQAGFATSQFMIIARLGNLVEEIYLPI